MFSGIDVKSLKYICVYGQENKTISAPICPPENCKGTYCEDCEIQFDMENVTKSYNLESITTEPDTNILQ